MPRPKPSRSGKSAPLHTADVASGAPGGSAPVLLAVTGESPAILTETVWALARKEQPAIFPSRIVVVTTTVGARRIHDELLASSAEYSGRSPWQALRDELLAGRPDVERLLVLEDPRIIAGRAGADGRALPLDDLRTRADNDIAADFILNEVRGITHNSDTRLIASIAGGRKTMGALLYAAMTLVGRETDRLTHVLVNAPFDQRLDPPFFFPAKKATHHALRARDGSAVSRHSSAAARIELADVPFVPLRNAFEDLHAPVGGFAGLVARYSRELRELAEPPAITFDAATNSVGFDGRPVHLENAAQLGVVCALFALQAEVRVARLDFETFAGIARAWHGGDPRLPADRKAAAQLAARTARPSPAGGRPDWVNRIEVRDVTRALSNLRMGLKTACPHWKVPARSLLLPPFRFAAGA